MTLTADHDSPQSNSTSPGATPQRRKRFSVVVAKTMRWLHIYLSMLSFAIVMFFSITGITLNHPTWFGANTETVRESAGEIDADWIAPTKPVDKLEIVEFLRSRERVRGAVEELTIDEYQIIVTFRAPAYSADVFIDRETNRYELVESSFGLAAMLNDLHKGRDSGSAWSIVIDISAILMTLVSLTGFTLIFFLKRHRTTGIIVAFLGTVGALAIWATLVNH